MSSNPTQLTPLQALQKLGLQGAVNFQAGGQALSRGTSFGLAGNDGAKLAEYYAKTYPELGVDTTALTDKNGLTQNALEFLSSLALMGPVVGAGEAAAGKVLATQPVQKVLQKLPEVAQKFLPDVVKGAAGFGLYEGINQPLQRIGDGMKPLQSLQQLPQDVASGLGTGAVFGAAMPALRMVGDRLFGGVSKAAPALLPEQAQGLRPLQPQGLQPLPMPKQGIGLQAFKPKALTEKTAFTTEKQGMANLLSDATQLGQLDSIPAFDFLDGFGAEIKLSKLRFDKQGRPMYEANIPGQRKVFFAQNDSASSVASNRGVAAFIQKNGGMGRLQESLSNIGEAGMTTDQVAALDNIAKAQAAPIEAQMSALERAQEEARKLVQQETKAIKMAPTQAAADAAMENVGNATINPMVANPAQVEAAQKAYISNTERLYQTGDGAPFKQSKFIDTAKQADITLPQVADELAAGYTPITNAETMAKAQELNATNPEAAAALMNADILSADGVAVAMDRVRVLQNEGRYTEAVDLLETMAQKASAAGQSIQALAMYSRLTPEGALRAAVKVADEAGTKVTEDLAGKIKDKADEIAKLPEGNEKQELTKELLKLIASAAPASMWQKLTTLQTMAQLLNPKTIIRNLIGNAGFAGVEASKDVLGLGIDSVLSVFTGVKTKTLPNPVVAARGFARGLRAGVRDAMRGLPDSTAGKFDFPKTPAFNDPVFGTLEKTMGVALRGADKAFYQMAYDSSLATQMKVSQAATVTPEMVAKAHADGLYATFQDQTVLSEVFGFGKKALNAISPESIDKIGTKRSVLDNKFGAGEFLLKYPKTPANLLARALDYGPVGILKGGYQAIRPMLGKPFDQAKFVDDLSRGLVGSGAGIGAGYYLGKLGILTAEGDPDKDINAIKQVRGQRSNQLNVDAFNRFWMSGFNPEKARKQEGDLLVSYDWAQPMAIVLQAGVNMAKAEGTPNEEEVVNYAGRVAEAVMQGADTLTEQGMLRGFRDVMNARDEDGKPSLAKGAINVASGIPSSFTPTVLNQVTQLTDNTTRETYSPDVVEQAVNKVKARVPGLAQTLPERFDTLGNSMERYQGGSNNPFNVFLNPAFVSKLKSDPSANEVLAIYENSGETQQAPRVVPKTLTVNGEKIKLTGAQISQYQQYVGGNTKAIYENLLQDPLFARLDDSGRADVMASVLTSVNSAAKIDLFGAPIVRRRDQKGRSATDRLTLAIQAGNMQAVASQLMRKSAKRLRGSSADDS